MNFKRCFGTIYKTITHHCSENCRDDYGGTVKQSNLFVIIGKSIPYLGNVMARIWTFNENIPDDMFDQAQSTFQQIYFTASTDNKNDTQPIITRDETTQHNYIINDWRYIVKQNIPEPIIQRAVEADCLADFSCNGLPFDIRFMCDKYHTVTVNAPATKYYDSKHEQHTTVYTFYDAIHVHFIKEFDITNDTIKPRKINRIQIELDRRIDFECDESKGLFEQILSLILFNKVKDVHQHTYNLNRKFCK